MGQGLLLTSVTAEHRAGDSSEVPRSRHRYPHASLCFLCGCFCKGTVEWLCMGKGWLRHEICCTPSMQHLAELVFFQLQETVLGRDSLDEVLTFYNPVERKE